MRVGSSPISMGTKSSTAPATLRVFHSSEASPQPYRPAWSVSTRTKTQLRISALQTVVLTAVIFIGEGSYSCIEASAYNAEGHRPRRRGALVRPLSGGPHGHGHGE